MGIGQSLFRGTISITLMTSLYPHDLDLTARRLLRVAGGVPGLPGCPLPPPPHSSPLLHHSHPTQGEQQVTGGGEGGRLTLRKA